MNRSTVDHMLAAVTQGQIVAKRAHVRHSQEELERLLAEWQTTLRLQDWDVKVLVARGNGLNLPEGIQGRSSWVLPKKQAFIRIIDPVDWDPDIVFEQDMERTLVHELLHLHCAAFGTFKEGTPENTSMEQAIDQLAKALVMLKRKPQAVRE